MTDDDLDIALRRWADATDPSASPVRGADIRAAAVGDGADRAERSELPGSDRHGAHDADDGGTEPPGLAAGRPGGPHRRARRRPLPWVAAAAAVVIVAALVAVWRNDSEPSEQVTTDPTATTDDGHEPAGRVRTQVVVETDAALRQLLTVERVEVVGPEDAQVMAAPLRRGITLVLDDDLPAGEYLVRVTSDVCAPTSRCRPDAEGRPPASDVIDSATCEQAIEVGGAPSRVVLRSRALATEEPTCALVPAEPPPVLTNPPGWSLRPRLPWTCGNGALDAGFQMGSPAVAEAAWQCFLDAAEDGRPIELPATEASANDDVRDVWWRVLPSTDRPVEVFRSPWSGDGGAWTVQRCAEVPRAFIPEREAEAGCDRPEELSLELPPLDEPVADEPVDPAGAGAVVPIQLVVEAVDPPIGEEGVINRWVARVDGSQVASGAVRFGRGDAETALVAEVEAPGGAQVEVTWELYDCPGSCPTVGPDGAPVNEAFEPFDECRADPVLPTIDEPIVVVALSGGGPTRPSRTCTAETTDELPALTVPPAWSRREVLPPLCGDDWAASMPADPLYEGAPSPSRDVRLCLLRRFQDRARAELTSSEHLADGSTRPLVFRVQPTVVEVVRPPRPGSDEAWTRQVCTGLTELPASPWIEATGCGPEEEMPLTRP